MSFLSATGTVYSQEPRLLDCISFPLSVDQWYTSHRYYAVVYELYYFPLSQWFRRIVENRAHDNEDVENLTDINDIRNGMLAFGLLHT
jgi:hypothetical protein